MKNALQRIIRKRRLKWESLCNQCGVCCYEKIVIRGRIHINLDSSCRFLDPYTKTCHVYSQRFTRCRDCARLTLRHALFASYLPETCGYVQKYRRRNFFKPRYSHGSVPVARRTAKKKKKNLRNYNQNP